MKREKSVKLHERNFCYLLLGLIPGLIFLLLSVNVSMLIFPVIITVICLRIIWFILVNIPISACSAALKRAIGGDCHARFWCSKYNKTFFHLAYLFNQFMDCTENQTEELTKNRQLMTMLYENEKIYRSALELTCERIFEADLTHNRVLYGQDVYSRTFPFLKTEMFDDLVNSIAENAIHEDDVAAFKKAFSRESLTQHLRKTDSTEVELEYRQKCPGGKNIWVSANVILLNNSQKGNLKVIGYVKNIDERKRRDLEIYKASQKDGLTGIYNKKVTQTLIDNFLTGEGQNGKHAVIMADIDNFKHINDTFGHIQGDIALMKVAQQLQNLFRFSDIVGRIGGDEFLVLLKNYTSVDTLIIKLQNICSMFSKIRLENEDYRISGSIGVSLYPEDGKNYSELYKKSDVSLYYSKEHGKNQFYIYGGRFLDKYFPANKDSNTPQSSIIEA